MILTLMAGLCALLGAGLGACLYLFFTVKRDLHAAGKRWAQKQQEARGAFEKLRAEFEQIGERIQDAEANAGLLIAPPPALSGLNLGKRSQVIRMFRRGDRAPQIAAALRIPVCEVELLLKVHRIVLSAPL
jgi:hypothetical protein